MSERTAGGEEKAADYLDFVPVPIVGSEERADDGVVVLLVPRYRDWLWGRLVQPYLGKGKRHVRVPLEKRGSVLWRAMDGRRSVRELVTLVREVSGDDQVDLPRRVSLYVQAFADNGFVRIDRGSSTDR